MSEEQPAVEQTPVEAPVETPVVETKSFITEDGSWNREAFGELGEHGYFDKYKTPEDSIKGGINAQKLVSQRIEEYIQSDDPDIVAKRLEAAGVPKDASGYEFNIDLPEDLPISKERIEASKEIFKDLGIPKSAAEKLIQWDIDNAKEEYSKAVQAQESQLEEATTALKTDWKDKYDYNVSKVADTFDHLGLSKFKDNPAIGSNPEFIQAVFENIVPLVDNDTLIEARQSQSHSSSIDNLNAIEDKIYAWDKDDMNSPTYKKLLQDRLDILKKVEQ